MKQLEIGDRCEVYRINADDWNFGFKIGSWRYGTKTSNISSRVLRPDGGYGTMFTSDGVIIEKEVTHVATLVIKQLKNGK